MTAVELQRRLSATEAALSQARKRRHALCMDVSRIVFAHCKRTARIPSPIRKVRFSDASWDLILQACALDKTMTRTVLVGAIVEALLVLKDAGHDLDLILEQFCQSNCRFLKSISGSPIGDVLARMEMYGYTPKRKSAARNLESGRNGG